MLVEDWAEFIKNVLSPSAFKEVGVAALRALYGRPVVLTDGTGDGGVDAWLELSTDPVRRVPVQFHAGRSVEWDAKLESDVAKPQIKASPAGRLFFVCAQTPTAEAAQRKIASCEARHGIAVTLVDARTIASLTHEPSVLAALHRVLNEHSTQRPRAPRSVADEARLSFGFFHEASGDFREAVARAVLATCLARATAAVPAEQLVTEALALVGGGLALRRLFRRQLDAFVADQRAVLEGDRVRATPALVDATRAALQLQASAEEKLRADCVAALQGKVHSEPLRRETVDAVFEDLGLLLRESLVERLAGSHENRLAARLNAVERRVADALKPRGGEAREALKALIEVASRSIYGHSLAAAELFLQLTGRDTTELARVLSGRDRVSVVLDTSMAMPLLCALLDRVASGWVTSELALELRELLRARGIGLGVPHVYVEEMAAHLLAAAKRYRPLVGQDPDLARSENFFVAHYHAVCASQGAAGTQAGFDEFLSDLGLPTGWETDEFVPARRQVEKKLREHLARYELTVWRIPYTEALALPNEPAREETVLRHDRCVVRWLDAQADEAEQGLVLCTQDRWLLQAVAGREWASAEPAALVDLVQLLRPQAPQTPLASLRELAARFDDAVRVHAAGVWDVLAKLEGPQLADRTLLRRAKEFKDAWLARERAAERPRAADWQRFKAGLSPDS